MAFSGDWRSRAGEGKAIRGAIRVSEGRRRGIGKTLGSGGVGWRRRMAAAAAAAVGEDERAEETMR